jgi:hypothetical protein
LNICYGRSLHQDNDVALKEEISGEKEIAGELTSTETRLDEKKKKKSYNITA